MAIVTAKRRILQFELRFATMQAHPIVMQYAKSVEATEIGI